MRLNMFKKIAFSVLVILLLFSCKKEDSLKSTNEKVGTENTKNNTEKSLYTEVLSLNKQSDYDTYKCCKLPQKKYSLKREKLLILN